MRTTRTSLAGCVAAAVAAFLCFPGNAAEVPSTARLGSKIDAPSLNDLQDKKAVVVVFLSFECPVCTSYAQPLADLAKAYGERGVAFVGVCTNPELSAAEVARQAREFKLPFPVLKDDKHAAADALRAEVTPEAFVLDGGLVLRYRGRIDDAYQARLKKNVQITRHDLRNALDQVLAGKPVAEPATRAVGCPIPRAAVATKEGGKVTYHRDVRPIVQNHCQVCHRPGEVGPFSLMTYKQAVNWAEDIKQYTTSRQMPPWKPGAGGPFHNERLLTPPQIATLVAWVDGGTPEGDPKDAPPPREFPAGWQLGKPDLVLTMDDDFTLGPTGRDHFRCMVLPTNLTEDKYVTAVELRPGNPRIVHHVLTFIDTTGQGRELNAKEKARAKKDDEPDGGPGYTVGMGVGFRPTGNLRGWAPGQVPRHVPEGSGFFLPKGSDIILQMHYHRNGRAEKDRTTIGLYFAKKPVERRFQGLVIPGAGQLAFLLNIPAGQANYRVNGSIWVAQDCTLHEITPHMHMVGKMIKATMTPPGGEPRILIDIDAWDYNWQETYVFKEPIKVKAGTRFDVEAFYDNSSNNPNNPNNPPKNVRFGEQTTNEMCFVFLGVTADKPGRVRQLFRPPAAE